MPNRIIKESINESRGLASCTLFAQDLFKRLVTYADDYGRFNADTEIMLARLYPRELGDITQDDVNEALIELSGIEKIQFYTAAPKKEIYGCFPKWGDHQRLRESKKSYPEPGDTQINDWYLRRFVSVDMKAKIIERDGFKCQLCGKFLTTCKDAKRFAKLGSGMYHIDHIVPCKQGGRATLENLRLTCPACNLSRKKTFSFSEIVDFAFFQHTAESGGEVPQVSAIACARAESESESEKEKESESNSSASAFDLFWNAYPKKVGKDAAKKAFQKVKAPIETLVYAIEKQKRSAQWLKDGGQYIPNPATWLNQGRWEDELPEPKSGQTSQMRKSFSELIREERYDN